MYTLVKFVVFLFEKLYKFLKQLVIISLYKKIQIGN